MCEGRSRREQRQKKEKGRLTKDGRNEGRVKGFGWPGGTPHIDKKFPAEIERVACEIAHMTGSRKKVRKALYQTTSTGAPRTTSRHTSTKPFVLPAVTHSPSNSRANLGSTKRPGASISRIYLPSALPIT